MSSPPEIRDILKSILDSVQAARLSLSAVLAPNNRPPVLQPIGGARPPLQAALPGRFAAAFGSVDAIEKLISLESSQEALSAAQKLPPAPRSANRARKRKRSENPKASDSLSKRPTTLKNDIPSTSAFPAPVRTEPWPVDSKSLEEYMRFFNKQGRAKLHFWSRSKITSSSTTANSSKPVYLRVTLQGLLIAFLDIEEQPAGGYQVLLVTVFGIREKKMPHASSDFNVFLKLSQFLTSVLQAHPEAEIPMIVDLILSYTDLYTDPCISCGQCWTVEGDIPPVTRIWIPYNSPSGSADNTPSHYWAARHALCSRVSV